jgi:crossover junction endodeoxyribonuclease RusA
MTFVSITLPAPVSTNALWRPTVRQRENGTRALGMSKTSKYEAWIKEAGWTLVAQRPAKIAGPYALTIRVACDSRLDLGNCEKAVSDLLQRHSIVENDRLAQKIVSEWVAPRHLAAGAGMSVMIVPCARVEP